MTLHFTNFYQCLIQDFNNIAAPLTFITKTTRLSKILAKKTLKTDNNKVIRVGSRVDKMFKNFSKLKILTIKKYKNISHIKATRKSILFMPIAMKVFNHF